jgi:SAM-dependent methyltransferase
MADHLSHIQRQRKIFDREFSGYERYHLENWRISYLRRMYEQLQLPTEPPVVFHELLEARVSEASHKPMTAGRFLDIGVGGSGYSVIEAARRSIPAVGIDLSEQGIRKAREFAQTSLGEGVTLCAFVVASADALPFANGVFSHVASVAVLEHVPRDDLACTEMARVTGPDGRVFVSVPNTYKRTPPLYQVLGRVNDRRVGHLRHYVAEELIARFDRLDMRRADLTYHAHNVKILQWLLTLIWPAMRRPSAALWWRMERCDLRQRDNPWASMFSLTLIKE